MWLYTRYGIFSIVRNGRGKKAGYKVRSRWPEHLRALLEYTGIGAEIQLSDDTDYPARIIIDDACYMYLMEELAKSVDYGNYKDQLYKDDFLPNVDGSMAAIYGAYNSCWNGGTKVRQELFPTPESTLEFYQSMTEEEWEEYLDGLGYRDDELADR